MENDIAMQYSTSPHILENLSLDLDLDLEDTGSIKKENTRKGSKTSHRRSSSSRKSTKSTRSDQTSDASTLGDRLVVQLLCIEVTTQATQTNFRWAKMALRWHHAKILAPSPKPTEIPTVIIKVDDADNVQSSAETTEVKSEEDGTKVKSDVNDIIKTKADANDVKAGTAAAVDSTEAWSFHLDESKLGTDINIEISSSQETSSETKQEDKAPKGLSHSKPTVAAARSKRRANRVRKISKLKRFKDACVDTSDLYFDASTVNLALDQRRLNERSPQLMVTTTGDDGRYALSSTEMDEGNLDISKSGETVMSAASSSRRMSKHQFRWKKGTKKAGNLMRVIDAFSGKPLRNSLPGAGRGLKPASASENHKGHTQEDGAGYVKESGSKDKASFEQEEGER